MKKLIVIHTIIIFIMLLLPIIVSCQQQPEPAPTSFPTSTSPTPISEPEKEYVHNQIIVKFKPDTPIEAQEQLHKELGTTVIHTSPAAGFQVLQLPEGKTVEEMVAIYSEQSIVEYAEPNYIAQLDR